MLRSHQYYFLLSLVVKIAIHLCNSRHCTKRASVDNQEEYLTSTLVNKMSNKLFVLCDCKAEISLGCAEGVVWHKMEWGGL